MGENGAGKSTLIKVLTGVEEFETGEIMIDGCDHAIINRSPQEAQNRGISTVYQEVNLCPNLTVAENLFIGREPRKGGLIDWKTMNKKAGKLLQDLDIHADVTQTIDNYSIAIQQMVAIARAVDMSAKVLILDEPTSALDPQGRAEVMTIIKNLADMGTTIILCTHILSDVERTANRIGIVRDGRMAVEGTIAEIKGQYDKVGKKIVMGIFGDPTAAIQPVSTLTGGNFYFDRQRAVFEIPLASDINEQETAHRLFDLLNSAGLTVSLFVIENKTLEQIYMETIG